MKTTVAQKIILTMAILLNAYGFIVLSISFDEFFNELFIPLLLANGVLYLLFSVWAQNKQN